MSELGGNICSLVRRAQSRIDQATLENELGNWEDARSQGQLGHSFRPGVIDFISIGIYYDVVSPETT